jgi:hypothetical protein
MELERFAVYLARAHDCDVIAPWLAAMGTWSAGALIDVRDPPSNETTDRRLLIACRIRTSDPAWCCHAIEAIARRASDAPALLVIDGPEGDGRLWSEARRALAHTGAAFVGQSADALVAVFDRDVIGPVPRTKVPDEFRVLAIVPTYNEESAIVPTVRDLVAQGLDVYVLDNCSTDATVARARTCAGVVAIERFPAGVASPTYDLSALMTRVEEIAEADRSASWVMLHDADERRRSPWPTTSLREALWHVDQCGYSAVDHVTANFWPVDDTFDPALHELEDHFAFFEFSDHPGHFHQRRAWKQLGTRVALARTAGHDVMFPGRRVYPYKFLLKHYPIQSRAHSERKLRDRHARWNPQERAWGWHRQYDELASQDVVRDPSTLTRFSPDTFMTRYLLERLSGVGVFRRPPAWATQPHW